LAEFRHLVLIAQAATPAVKRGLFPTGDEPADAMPAAMLFALRDALPPGAVILCGPGRAARETASALGLAAEVVDALHEGDFGRWAGRALEQVMAKEPDAARRWLADPAAAPHGGEGFAALRARVGAWLEGLPVRREIVAIAGASVVRAALLHALEAPDASLRQLDVPPLSMVRLSWVPDRWTVRLGSL